MDQEQHEPLYWLIQLTPTCLCRIKDVVWVDWDPQRSTLRVYMRDADGSCTLTGENAHVAWARLRVFAINPGVDGREGIS